MAKTSTRQHVRRDTHEEAEAAWARSDYDRVLELVAGDLTARARLLVARTQMRLRNHKAVCDALAQFPADSLEHSAEADILRAYAQDCIAGSAQSFPTTVLAGLTLSRNASHRLRTMLAFYRAYALFNRKEMQAAYVDAKIVAESTSSFYRAWGVNLMAWIEVTQKQFLQALDHFEQCMDLLAGPVPIDAEKRLNALHGFAFLSVDTLNRPGIAKLVTDWGALVAVPKPGRYYLQIQSYVAIAHALLGDDVAAFETLIDVPEPRERGPFTAQPHINLAALHSRRGSHDAAMLHLESARRILEATDWNREDDETRILLLLYAVEAASSNRPAASRLFTKAMNATGRKNSALAFDDNGRFKALALYAKGCIEAAAERMDDAVRDITEARDIWKNIGYAFRAQIADTTLIALGEKGTLALQARVRREFPASWLASDVKSAKRTQVSPLNDISEAEQRVIQGICEGLTSKQIAAKIGRSPSTIRNQTIDIYRTLGVKTRAALVALVMSEPPRTKKLR